ncbi:chromosome segregation protein SMC [Neolewinella lacunae]|uniref:Chromosome partition protein Smc n=1 Tax=Neolewinella lacunae TaxID=1517758 RepID=A0A923T7A7_9BACT|nr:chromosome segregation protein SMC [Neolewinella lacunae]MBC6994300.1 chromosome segregation protein SMC [Neolewinella lacunae]MDN3634943.1 chromosome segregation protein SMC [Neolewinella lacunae]
MRLRQLEIKGFKSFANTTVVNFDEDVIGIVGPNGSGKSNIVDAIRWVLGEQKGSELRLDKMSSIIFNGTKKKKAGNMASVSLTFDNDKGLLPTEYNTVTITRLLYRSGDSEYRLNGVQCRLKDITSLLLDTGIGSNSYAIIALGMVDDILADKDNSRRRMFEQAAGVSKYKARKRESLQKLKATEDDLDRIEDLLHEINNNLASLEKQAQRARRYLELKAQYREQSLQLTQVKVADLRNDYGKLKGEITAAEDQYRSVDVNIRQLEATLEAEKAQHIDKEKALGERQKLLNELVNELRGLENEKQMLAQRKTFVRRQTEKLQQDITTAGGQLAEYLGQIERMEAQIANERTVETERQEAVNAAEQALAEIRSGHETIKGRLEEGLKAQQQEERNIFELEKRKAINGNQVENFRFQIERNVGEMEDRRGEKESLEASLKELEAEEAVALTALEKLELAETERREALDAATEKVEQLQNDQSKINRGLDARRNEFKLTKSMIDSLEGFPESIRFLSQSKQWKEDPQLLSDLVLVDQDYRVAIENYLEGFLNYYVVDNAEEARQAISLLSKSQKGKANFFLLDAIGPYQGGAALLPGGTRLATDVVQVDKTYQPLLDHLLHNVLVTDSDELPGQPPEGITILSRSGRYIRRPYSVSGGSVGLFEGKKIGRKKNLEVLEKAIAEAEKQVRAVEKELYQERNRLNELRQRRVDKDIQEKQRELSRLQQKRAGLKARVESFANYFGDTEAKNVQLAQQVDAINQANAVIDRDLAKAQATVEALREQLAGTDGNYRQLSEQLSAASAAYNEQNIQFIRQQNKIQTLEQEVLFRRNRLQELGEQDASNKEQLERLAVESRQFEDQEITLARNLEQMYANRSEYQTTLNAVEQAYFAARTGINNLEDELRRENRRRQDGQILVNQLKEKFTDIKFRIDGISERLKIEFNVGLEELSQLEIPEWVGSVGDLEVKVERLRGRIGNYGEINPLAVEAYDEMKERHDTIAKQRDDIVAAKNTLVKTIKEIEETATVQFLQAFERVRTYFIDVFRSLFTEDDNCDLILLDPEDPLESKIEIVAKPKGKRPTTISQLSGGEKTLTATALLFALYLLKPAPFCIFDEVDAPLDDANIAKFNRIIKKFSKESQFIIVTHNKLTMEAVDTIYGVYTNEQQGSGVIPVQFTELEGSTMFSAV